MSANSAKVAVVTGGSRGLGRLVASALAADGFAVGLLARSADELADSRAEIELAGGTAASVVSDVSDPDAATSALIRLRQQLGPIDLLVNNAGVTGPVGLVWRSDPSAWWEAIEINLRGTFTCSRLVLPEMIARRRGRIINISSHAGVFRWPRVSAYSVSKAAITKLTENVATESRDHGVAVFSVHPGLLPIGLSAPAFADGTELDSDRRRIANWIRGEFSRGRGVDPAAAVELIRRLASGRYDALSGRQLSVHDDLDAILTRIDDVRDRELYVLGLQQLPA